MYKLPHQPDLPQAVKNGLNLLSSILTILLTCNILLCYSNEAFLTVQAFYERIFPPFVVRLG